MTRAPREPRGPKICPLCDEAVGGRDADEASDYAGEHPGLGTCCASCLEDLAANDGAGPPVHLYHEAGDPTHRMKYCDDCKLYEPCGLIVHVSPAPSGAKCDDCETTNPAREGGVA